MLEQTFLGINIVEIIGYIASTLILISLNMTSIIKLRWFNLAGAIFFAVYGFLFHAYPVAVMNILIALTNVYNLIILNNKQDLFNTQIMQPKDAFFNKLIEFHAEDIAKFYPKFKIKDDMICLIILRNMQIAGIFIGSKKKDKLKIEVDYALKKYRDFKVGNFLYPQLKEILSKEEIDTIYCNIDENLKYASKMGFSLNKIDGKDIMNLKI